MEGVHFSMKMWRKLLCALVCLSFLTGCISYRGRELPRFEYSNLHPVKPNLSITYSAKVVGTGNDILGGPPYKGKSLDVFLDEINRVFKESGLFSRIENGDSMTDIQLDMTLYHWNNGITSRSLLTQYYRYFSGLTLYLLPYYNQQNYVLVVDVLEEGGGKKKYEFKHSMHDVFQFLGIVTFPFNDRKGVIKKTIDDLVLNLLVALQEDGFLAPK